MKNKEIAGIFNQIADALEFKNENVFKILAYRKAARVLEELVDDVAELSARGKLQELPGIGRAIAEKIAEYLATGRMKKFEEATRGIPPSLLELLNIQNIGPKTLALANKELGVKTIAGMKKAIASGRLARLPMMGEKKAENIMKGIERYERSHERLAINVAEDTATRVVAYLEKNPLVAHVSAAGSLRRWKETIGDIDILATGRNGEKIIEIFTRFPGTRKIAAAGGTKGSIITDEGVQVDLRIVEGKSYGAALQYFTGSKEHNVKLRALAAAKGLKLNEYGLYRGQKLVAGKTEEEIYEYLGLKYIEPELREDRGEIEASLKDALPRLVTMKDIRGDLQMHSTYSDSEATIEELAREAQKIGYEYILLTDHSRSASYAHGMEIPRLRRQWQEIDRLNAKFRGFRILKGIEVDILKDGRLDYPDKILKELDLVLASIHQGFTKNVTERMCKAMDNPYVDIIGHPTGRLISSREGYVIDLNKVMEKAAATGTWLECNAYPDRLDLNDANLRKAKEMGIRISIGTDAHGAAELRWFRFGLETCRRAWLEAREVVNTYPLEKLRAARKINRRS
jgi:DNA polymerase (family 10)